MIDCPACGAENPDGFRFCGQCGARLAAPAAAAEERKVVTTLFCDLVAFTAMSEAADPEDVDAVLRAYHAAARKVIESHGGTVEKFIGDAVVGVFGVPAAHEDDPERAVRAGLRIVQALEGATRPDGGPLEVRIGVNTGEALVRLDVTPGSGEGFLTGDAVNVAARLQAAAPAGGVVVGEVTHALTEKAFVCEALEALALKGKSEPVSAWLFKKPRSRTGLRTAPQTTTPFFGREAELAALQAALADATETGSARFCLLVGEPGIGKSRLVLELSRYLEAVPDLVTWRQGRCLPYGEGVTFWALGEIVKAHAGIVDSDGVVTVEEKLDAILPEGEDRPWLRQRLRPLLGLEASQASREESFAAWTRFVEIVASGGPTVLVVEDLHWAGEAMPAFIEHLLAQDLKVPLLVVATTRPELLQQHEGALTAAAAVDDRLRRITLPTLSQSEAAALIVALLHAELPEEIGGRVLDLVGGNPLFAEQYGSLLLDRGLLVRAIDGLHLEVTEELPLPETVQAVLAARLDTLSPEHKAFLCDAAVIGETFWRGGVAALSGCAASEVEEAMEALADRDLVRPMVSASMAGEAEYIFWHALARDVAYAQLPRRVRLAKHTAAADWLRAKAGERVEELAYHYATALDLARATGDRERAEGLLGPAVHYLSKAADRNLALDVAVAEQQYAHALGLVSDDAPQRPWLLARWAEALQQRGRFRESADAFLAAADGLRSRGDLPAAAAALARSWGPLNDLGDPRAQAVVADAEHLLEGTPDSPELVAVLAERAVEHTMCGDWRAAVASAERALTVAGELGLDLPARALGFRGMARCLGGDAGGIDDLRRALAEAQRQGLGRDVAVLQSNLGMGLALHHGFREVLGVHREGLEYAQRHGIEEFVLSFRAELIEDLTGTGDWDEALDEVATLRPVLERADFAWMLVTVRTNELQILARRGGEAIAAAPTAGLLGAARQSELPEDTIQTLFACAEAAQALGDGARALALLSECVAVPDAGAATGYAWCLAEAVRVALGAGDPALAARLIEVTTGEGPMHERGLASARAALLEHRGDVDEAAEAHAAAASLWCEFGDPYEEGRALLGQGRCLVALGRAPEAAAPLAAAREIFARLGARPALAETDAVLADAGLAPGAGA